MKITKQTCLYEIMKLANTFEEIFTLEIDADGDCKLTIDGEERITAHNSKYLEYQSSNPHSADNYFQILDLSEEKEILDEAYLKLETNIAEFNQKLSNYRRMQRIESQLPVPDDLPVIGVEMFHKDIEG